MSEVFYRSQNRRVYSGKDLVNKIAFSFFTRFGGKAPDEAEVINYLHSIGLYSVKKDGRILDKIDNKTAKSLSNLLIEFFQKRKQKNENLSHDLNVLHNAGKE